MKITITVIGAILSVILSTAFICIGYSGPDEYIAPASNVSHWIKTDSDGTLERYACPETGKLAGAVWLDNSGWFAKVWPNSNMDQWGHLEAQYKDKVSAEHAAEKYIQIYRSCED